eukprot:5373598-Pleurochrysis_carterae.AAC.2
MRTPAGTIALSKRQAWLQELCRRDTVCSLIRKSGTLESTAPITHRPIGLHRCLRHPLATAASHGRQAGTIGERQYAMARALAPTGNIIRIGKKTSASRPASRSSSSTLTVTTSKAHQTLLERTDPVRRSSKVSWSTLNVHYIDHNVPFCDESGYVYTERSMNRDALRGTTAYALHCKGTPSSLTKTTD